MDRNLKHLLQVLAQYLDQEQEYWMPFLHADSQSLEHREDIVAWIGMLNDALGFCSNTTFMAVDIFDRFLHRVRAQVKYLKCIALTCLYLAAKINEEDEVIPSVSEFVRKTGCRYSVAELKRMELCILAKLNWNVKQTSTILDFLYLFDAVVAAKCPEFGVIAQRSRKDLMYKHAALVCTSDSEMLKFAPSTAALTIFSTYLERVWLYWMPAITTLQAFTRKSEESMLKCRMQLTQSPLGHHVDRVIALSISSRSLSSLKHSLIIKPLQILDELPRSKHSEFPHCSPPPLPPAKRRKIRQEVDDTAYDDIRHLYDCTIAEMTCAVTTSCSTEVATSSNNSAVFPSRVPAA